VVLVFWVVIAAEGVPGGWRLPQCHAKPKNSVKNIGKNAGFWAGFEKGDV
jgi:hypothetical protein